MPRLEDYGVYGAALEHSAREWGGVMRARSRVLNIDVNGQVLVDRDPERVFVLFLNVEAAAVEFVAPGPCGLDAGIRLDTTTRQFSFNAKEHGTIPSEEWRAASTVGGGAIYVLELRRETVVEKRKEA